MFHCCQHKHKYNICPDHRMAGCIRDFDHIKSEFRSKFNECAILYLLAVYYLGVHFRASGVPDQTISHSKILKLIFGIS